MSFIRKHRLAFVGWIVTLSIIVTVFSSHRAMAEDNPVRTDDHLRIGMGFGISYGLSGFNLAVRLNDSFEATGGYGWAGSGFHAWSFGGRMYPFPEMKRFRPRLTLLMGVIGKITSQSINYGSTTVDVYEGGAVGGGFDWKFFRRHSLDLDLYLVHVYPSQEDKGLIIIKGESH